MGQIGVFMTILEIVSPQNTKPYGTDFPSGRPENLSFAF